MRPASFQYCDPTRRDRFSLALTRFSVKALASNSFEFHFGLNCFNLVAHC